MRARYNIVKSPAGSFLKPDRFYSMMIRSIYTAENQMILSGMAKCKARNDLGEEMEKRR